MHLHVPHPKIALASVALAAMFIGLSGATIESARYGQPEVSTAPVPSTASQRPVDVTVTATEFKLSPSPLVVPLGRPVRLTFINKGASIHNWTVQGLPARDVRLLSLPKDLASGFAGELHTAIGHDIPFGAANPGERSVVEFTPLKAGTYKTLCTIPGHAQMGMVATLVVTSNGVAAPSTQPAANAASAASLRATRLPNPPVAPPVGRRGPTVVHVNLETKEVDAYIDDGVRYKVWTFNGTVPGPMIRVRVGDTVEVTLKNAPNSMMSHSIDLHAVSGPGGGSAATSVAPDQTKSFTFKALNPGVFIYHCATAPVAEHIANGMYGMIVVEPAGGLPRVDREFYLMQGEYYFQGARTQPGERQFSMDKMMNETPDYVVYNGAVGALTGPRAFQARVGQTVRIFFGNGGPDLTSSFHMIGTVFDRVTIEGTTDWEHNVAVTEVPAGGATIAEFTARYPGKYMLLDHSISRTLKGGLAELDVTGHADATIFKPLNGTMVSMKH